MKNFSECKNIKNIVKNRLKELGYESMTEVQEKTLEMNGNLVVQSPTGSGKTLCYAIPIANNFYTDHEKVSINKSNSFVKSLIILPTRELCEQVQTVLEDLKLKCQIFIGGTETEENLSLNVVDIVIGTPGRLLQILKAHSKHFQSLKFLILDEADKLLSQGFERQLNAINLLISKKNRITMLFSATIDDNVLQIMKGLNYTEVKCGNCDIPENLKISYLEIDFDKKLDFTLKILKQKTIVFFATCAEVDFYYEVVNEAIKKGLFFNHEARILIKMHGKMPQSERTETYRKIQNLTSFILFTTDVSARGIDFKFIDLVVHFDVPKDCSNILHRSGRTARNGAEGESLLFLMPNEIKMVNYLRLKYKKLEIVRFEKKELVDNKNNLIYKKCTLNLNYGNYDDNCNQEKIENLQITNRITIGEIAVQNDKFIPLATRAFVSYIRSYKEHILNFVLNLKELNIEKATNGFYLQRTPKMKELNKKRRNFSNKLEK